jgi:hypothetical protein
MTGLGVTASVVDEMDMREINDLMAYWSKHPPAHIAIRQTRDVVIHALGGKPPEAEPAKKSTAEELAAMFGLSLPKKGCADGK